MMDDHTGVKAAKVCGAVVFTCLLALLLIVRFDFYYDLNDDTMIKDIVSGAYTGHPSGYCIQMLYPLAWCLALFYRAIPSVPWYGLFLCLCQFGVLFLIAARLLLLSRRLRTGILALAAEAVFVCGLFLRQFVVVQYSVTSGICMAGAVFLFLTAPRADKPSVFFRQNLQPLFLVLLSFLIRTEVCIMLLPFLLLAGLVKWCGEDRFFTSVNLRKYITLIVTAFLCFAAVYSLDLVAYRGSEWVSFRKFFDARTKLYDFYGLPDYEDNRAFYESIGLSRESYTLLENYNFALDESIDTWRLEAIVAYQEQLAEEGRGLHDTFGFVSRNSVKQALWKYREQLQENLPPAGAAVILMYLLYLILCVAPAKGRRRAGAVLKIVSLLAVRSILWLYLCMVDRVLDRVTMPLLIMEFAVLTAFLICDSATGSAKDCAGRRFRMAGAVSCLLCVVGALAALVANQQSVRTEYGRRAAADERWEAMMDYCRKNGNNYYIIDVYSSTSYQGAPYSEKMFAGAGSAYKNFDLCGGWAAKSPLARQKLERHHLKDIQSALCSPKAGAYFIADAGKDLGWLAQYYAKRGIAIELRRVDQIRTGSAEPAFDVYELVGQTGKG